MSTGLPDSDLGSDMDVTEVLSQKSTSPEDNEVVEKNTEDQEQEEDNLNERAQKRERQDDEKEPWQKVENLKKPKKETIEIFLSSSEKLPKQFAIAKLLTIAGLFKIKKIKYINQYKLKLEVPDETYAKKVIDCEEFKKKEWKVQRVTEVEMSYGIIRGVDLELTDSDILRDISSPSNVKIVSAKRLQKRGEGNKWVPSEVAKVIFSGSQLPAYVNIDNLRVKVEPFIFPATQCSKCWKFGHTKARCSSRNVICPKCSGQHENCEIEIFQCVNCKGNHMALNRSCPVYLKEKKIRELMAEFNCTYRVACNIYVEPEQHAHKEIRRDNNIQEHTFRLNTHNSFIDLDLEETSPHKYVPILSSFAQTLKRPKSPPGIRAVPRNASSSISKNERQQYERPADRIPEESADNTESDQLMNQFL
ncbi:uncharacterized protein LOC134805473 [Cydia splendana]|uniref:uncharacterized protein LOC134805473 n=1 Tax=Cydia splendana TaxID=1100963 RepID=UPI00300D33F6